MITSANTFLITHLLADAKTTTRTSEETLAEGTLAYKYETARFRVLVYSTLPFNVPETLTSMFFSVFCGSFLTSYMTLILLVSYCTRILSLYYIMNLLSTAVPPADLASPYRSW